MVVVSGAVVRLTSADGGPELIGERGRPFLPGEMPLLGELDRERERLGLPGFSKHRAVSILRQAWQRLDIVEVPYRIRLAQGNRPTCLYRLHPAARPVHPTAR